MKYTLGNNEPFEVIRGTTNVNIFDLSTGLASKADKMTIEFNFASDQTDARTDGYVLTYATPVHFNDVLNKIAAGDLVIGLVPYNSNGDKIEMTLHRAVSGDETNSPTYIYGYAHDDIDVGSVASAGDTSIRFRWIVENKVESITCDVVTIIPVTQHESIPNATVESWFATPEPDPIPISEGDQEG